MHLLLLLACHHDPPATSASSPATRPVLPSPEASLYAAGIAEARDPLVRQVAGTWPWDEALSGAAGALAMDAGSELSLGTARWAALRAGYPYPVRVLLTGIAAAGGVPDDLTATLRAQWREGDRLGLARARVGDQDRWVAVLSHPGLAVVSFPRQVAPGEVLALQADRPADWALSSPTGKVSAGALPADVSLGETGEWWLEIRSPDGALALSVPVYAGLEPPPASPLPIPGEAPAGSEAALNEAMELLAELREQFEAPALTYDPTLAVVTREPLVSLLAGSWDAATVARRIASTGFLHGGAAASCVASTVPLCLDSMVRSVEGRAALLPLEHHLVGGSAQVSTDGVALVLALAAE